MLLGCQEVLVSYGADSLKSELQALNEVIDAASKERSSECKDAQHRYVEFDQ